MNDSPPNELNFANISPESTELDALSDEEKRHAIMLLGKLKEVNVHSAVFGLLDANVFVVDRSKERIIQLARQKVMAMICAGAQRSVSGSANENTACNVTLAKNILKAVEVIVRTEIEAIRASMKNRFLELTEDEGAPVTPTAEHAKPHPMRGQGAASFYPRGREKME